MSRGKRLSVTTTRRRALAKAGFRFVGIIGPRACASGALNVIRAREPVFGDAPFQWRLVYPYSDK